MRGACGAARVREQAGVLPVGTPGNRSAHRRNGGAAVHVGRWGCTWRGRLRASPEAVFAVLERECTYPCSSIRLQSCWASAEVSPALRSSAGDCAGRSARSQGIWLWPRIKRATSWDPRSPLEGAQNLPAYLHLRETRWRERSCAACYPSGEGFAFRNQRRHSLRFSALSTE